jgi:hypothetical protein
MPVKITPTGGYASKTEDQAADLGRVNFNLVRLTELTTPPIVTENALRTFIVGFSCANNLSPLL